MADLSDDTNWSELDANNNRASPNGWPEGMMPSGVNDSARSDKGALKRFWDRANPVQTITPAPVGIGGVWTFTTVNPTYPLAYIDGEVFTFTAGAASVGGDQFQINTLLAKPIQKLSAGSWVAIAAQDIITAFHPYLVYNASLNAGAGAFVLTNPYVPVGGDGSGGLSVPGALSVGGGLAVTGNISSATGSVSAPSINATGSSATLSFADSTGGGTWLWYSTGSIARLGISGDKMAVDSGGNATLGGGYLHFAGTTGAVNGAGGPLIYGDPTNMVLKSTGSVLFQNSTGANVAQVSGSGNVSCTGTISSNGNINANNGTVNVNGMVLSNNGGRLYCPNDIQTNGSLLGATLSVGGIAVSNASGLFNVAADIKTTGLQTTNDVHVGASLYLNGLQAYNNGGFFYVVNAVNADSCVARNDVTFGPNSRRLHDDGVSTTINSSFRPSADNASICGGSGLAWGNVVSYIITNLSDAALKTDIAELPPCLDLLAAISPSRYRWREGPDTGRTHWGFVAQDVAAVMKHAGHDFGGCALDGDRQALVYSELVALLWKATQELSARVATLEAK
jgi:hypothetical protein